ncbi:hypothetical protein [Xanthomonas hortorum]|uniref:hypothetical protein n=1 Tax=Xanthomonas hortorum TaxID=56454 RepID=UPI001F21ABA7|nr:hypothetical protein [Xanthomonas hortorum]MCE4550551.1 hypothetical protein [Xanthomonas hortorum pv. vitians]
MDLFSPVVPADKLHSNFVNVIKPSRVGERAVVQGWAEGFPDRDGKFIKEFQTTFNSSFWEIYLHGVFKDYGFKMDWTKASPDFHLIAANGEVIVEAVTANAASGSIAEWEKKAPMTKEVLDKNFWPLNREAMIRLSNALSKKSRKYTDVYSKLPHVKGKPFVIAVVPFEQPDFQFQYDRPIRALLYDDYVDETAFLKEPHLYPNGPPSVALGSIEKDNGATIDLGIFLDDQWEEVSAVIFSCAATWGKAVAMSSHPALGFINTTWGGPEGPYPKSASMGKPSEKITDGLQVFHNPYAKYPLDPAVFRLPRVVQHYQGVEGYVHENHDNCLQFRNTFSINLK